MILLGEELAHEFQEFGVVLHDQHRVVFLCGGVIGFGLIVGVHQQLLFHLVRLLTVNGPVVCRQVDLVLAIRRLGDGQGDDERGALTHAALAVDLSVMELDEVARQREADARAVGVHPPVVAVEEAGIEMLHLVLGDADALIADFQGGLLPVSGQRHGDAPALLVVFHGIRQQVVEYLVDLVFVKPGVDALGRALHNQLAVFGTGHRTDALTLVSDKAREVAPGHQQFQLSGLRLPHLKDLAQQAGEPLDIVLHQSVIGTELRCFLPQLIDGGGDDGQRGEEFMGDIGEHHGHGQAVFGLQIVLVPTYPSIDGTGQQCGIDEVGPPGEIPRRQHVHPDAIGHLRLVPMAVDGHQPETIRTGRQVLISGLPVVGIGVVPLVVIVLQAVGVAALLLTLIGQEGEPDREFPDARGQGDLFGVERLARGDFFLESGVKPVVGHVVDLQV